MQARSGGGGTTGDVAVIGKEAAELVKRLTSRRLCQVVFDKAERLQRPEECAPCSSSHEGRRFARACVKRRHLQSQRRPGRRMPGGGRYGCRDVPDALPDSGQEEQLIYALLCRDKIAQQQADEQRKVEQATVFAARTSTAPGSAQTYMQTARASCSSARPTEFPTLSAAPRSARLSAASCGKGKYAADAPQFPVPPGVGVVCFEIEDGSASRQGGSVAGSAADSAVAAAARQGSSLPVLPTPRTSGSRVAAGEGSCALGDMASAVEEEIPENGPDTAWHGFATIVSRVNSGSHEYLESKRLGQLYDEWRESRQDGNEPSAPVRHHVCQLEGPNSKEAHHGHPTRTHRQKSVTTPVSARNPTPTRHTSSSNVQRLLTQPFIQRNGPDSGNGGGSGTPRSMTLQQSTRVLMEGDSRKEQLAARQAFQEQVLARRLFGVVTDRDNSSTDPSHEFVLCQQLDAENKHGMQNHTRLQELTREAEQLANSSKRTHVEGFPTLNLMKLHNGPWAMNV